MITTPEIFLFSKDKKGKYLQANSAYCNFIGISELDLIGLSDFDLCWKKEETLNGYKNDQHIVKSKSSKIFLEFGTGHQGKTIHTFSHKFPLLTKKRKANGIICMAFKLPKVKSRMKLDNKSNNHNMLEVLSNREQECLRLFLNGKTAKETAIFLDISYRTVEEYFSNIKKKLGCQTKRELLSILNYQPYEN